MSKEVESPSSPKPLSPLARSLALAGVALVLLALIVFATNYRFRQIRIAELERSVDALSEALEPTLLVSNNDKIERVIRDVATAGNYIAISYSDNSGHIVASTDSMKRGIKSEELRQAPTKAKAINVRGRIVVRRAVILAGDTRFGNLEVVAR